MKIKIFRDTDFNKLESSVNSFLADKDILVKDIKIIPDSSLNVLVVLYTVNVNSPYEVLKN